MRRDLFERAGTVCPACRRPGVTEVVQHPLCMGKVLREEGGFVLEGFLRCEGAGCGREYPILQGVPVILKDLEGWWNSARPSLTRADVVDPELARRLDALAEEDPDARDGAARLGAYADQHFLPKSELPGIPREWSPERYWARLVEWIRPPDGTVYPMALDAGCSVGRLTFELGRHSELAVGMDTEFDFVAGAAGLQRTGRIQYRRRTRARAWEPVTAAFPSDGNLLFLVGDALDPPFRAESFDFVTALNVVDSVRLPLVLLGQLDALLRPDGPLLLGSPGQWRTEVCVPDEWLETRDLDAPRLIRAILEGKALPAMEMCYEVVAEESEVPWLLQHDPRHSSLFLVHLMKLVKRQPGKDTT